tara:strand:- start:4694 stop:6085 length:1392 start_codon:yes stop_codon:yes gene_type:complete
METLQRTANRGSVSTGYDISNSVKLEDTNTEYLQRPASGSDGNRRTMTLSMWLKRTQPGNDHIFYSQGDHVRFRFKTSDYFSLRLANGHEFENESRVFRDPAAWSHMVVAIDTTQSTNSDRVKIYWNGVQETDFDTAQYPDLNEEFTLGQFSSVTTQLGFFTESGYGFDGYITEVNYIDGSQLAPTQFGEFESDSGIWIPKKYTGSYGSEGFFLNFDNSGSMGADSSGNSNNFNLINVSASNQATDTCTNNFCTLNPVVNFKYTTNGIINGATEFGDNTGGGVGGAFGTFAVTSGKWYWEMKLVQQNSHNIGVSAIDDGDNVTASNDPQDINSTFNFNISAARIEYFNGGSKVNGSLDAFADFHTDGDIISIALNMDDNQISIFGNGTLQSSVANSGLFDAANKMVVPFHATINDTVQYNFGGFSVWTPSSVATDENGFGSFEFAPPSGYLALCSKNLGSSGG